MKAVLMTAPGEPSVLEVREIDEPSITRETEMRVRLKAAGVNPIDTKLRRRGTFYPDRMPAVLGCDGAGVIEEVGAAVERFRPGEEIWFCSGGLGAESGTYAEYAVVDARYAARKPDSLSFVEAAAAPLVLITAWESLYDRAGLREGQRVLIHAGAGGVGHVAIQLAVLAGSRVCTTVGLQEKRVLARGLGAEEAILYKEKDFVDEVIAWTYGHGVDVALDTVGGDVFQATFPAVAYYGDLVTLLEPPPSTQWKEARIRNLRISQELMLTPMLRDLDAARRHHAHILESCGRWFDERKLRVHVQESLPLEAAAQAHARIEEGGMQGKLVLQIPE
jgi:NADPH2:quinone reductase